MAYPNSFYRLVMIGELYTDTWNTTLSIANPAGSVPAVSDALLESVAEGVATWFEDDAEMTGRVILTGIKLNRLTSAGLYADAATKEWTYAAPIYGAVGGNVAPQLTLVQSLVTSAARGPGSKGRMFLPPQAPLNSLGNDGRITEAQATGLATATVGLVTDLNTLLVSTGASVCVASKVGAGVFRPVTGVRCGRVPDTMRSRRSTQPESYSEVLI